MMTQGLTRYYRNFKNTVNQKENVSDERYKFFSRAQESGETIDQYVTVLKNVSETCEFGTQKNSLIKDRIVLGVNNCKSRERLLRVQELTLDTFSIGFFRQYREPKTSGNHVILSLPSSLRFAVGISTSRHHFCGK